MVVLKAHLVEITDKLKRISFPGQILLFHQRNMIGDVLLGSTGHLLFMSGWGLRRLFFWLFITHHFYLITYILFSSLF